MSHRYPNMFRLKNKFNYNFSKILSHFPNIFGKDGVYEKIKGQISAEVWKPDELEEFEDSEGNVLNKKVHSGPNWQFDLVLTLTYIIFADL